MQRVYAQPCVALAASMAAARLTRDSRPGRVGTLRPPLALTAAQPGFCGHPSHEAAPGQGTFTSSGHADGLPSAPFQLEEPATALGRTCLWFVRLSHSPLPSVRLSFYLPNLSFPIR